MKKKFTYFKKLPLFLLPISAIATFGVSAIVTGKSNSNLSQRIAIANKVTSPNILDEDDSIEKEKVIINKPIDFRQLESLRPEADKNSEWVGMYTPKNWKDIFDPELAFYHAREYGWRSIKDFENYMQCRWETTGGPAETTFAAYQDHDWIAWHFAPGGTNGNSYHDGVGSDIRPTWQGVELNEENQINNDIPWYLYDRGAKIFSFDNNNLENAFKRLVWLERIVPTTKDEIEKESYETKTPATSLTRNHYLVNGVFTDVLDPNVKYYYVKDDLSTFVRDTYGWKVIIAPDLISNNQKEKYETLFSMVLNPEANNKLSSWKYNDTRKFITASDLSRLGGQEEQMAIDKQRSEEGILSSELKRIHYPDDYLVNEDYRLGSSKLKEDAATWNGLYKLARKSASFTDMVNDPNTFLPQEVMQNHEYQNPYGRPTPWTFTHPWNGGGYSYLWVENGKGGRKIWKNLNQIVHKTPILPFVLDVDASTKAISDAIESSRGTDMARYGALEGFSTSQLWTSAKANAEKIMTFKYQNNLLVAQIALSPIWEYVKFKPNPKYHFADGVVEKLTQDHTPIKFVNSVNHETFNLEINLDPTVSQPWIDAVKATKDDIANFDIKKENGGFEYTVKDMTGGEIKFYGNYMHVFPGTKEGLQWFKDQKDEYNRFGY